MDCKDLDEAIEVAAEIPGARDGSVEVRPIWEMSATNVERAVTEAFREEWGRALATLIRLTGDWELAEECAQDAFATALERWRRDGRRVTRRVADHGGPQSAPLIRCGVRRWAARSCRRWRQCRVPTIPSPTRPIGPLTTASA